MTNYIQDEATGEIIPASEQPSQITKLRMAIKNVSKMSDEALRAALLKHGVDVVPDATRGAMMVLARQAKLWNYHGNIVKKDFKRKYAAHGGNCGDQVAQAFGILTDSEKGLAALKAVAEANEIEFSRWAYCNFGQKKMNLGNVLRSKIKRGEYVIINTTEFNLGDGEEAVVQN